MVFHPPCCVFFDRVKEPEFTFHLIYAYPTSPATTTAVIVYAPEPGKEEGRMIIIHIFRSEP
jgi:hypothetical protein